MGNVDVMFSSKSDIQETPQTFYNELNDEFHFTLDVCANDSNHKCKKYYTEADDGLSKPWTGVCWMNPPYSACKEWVKKARDSAALGATVVALVPARTDTRWFHDYVLPYSTLWRNKNAIVDSIPVITEVRFIKGRLKFGESRNSAPFPSMVVIFKPKEKTTI